MPAKHGEEHAMGGALDDSEICCCGGLFVLQGRGAPATATQTPGSAGSSDAARVVSLIY